MTMSKEDAILEDTFCYYCQADHVTPRRLQAHLLVVHRGTYAASSVLQAREYRAAQAKVAAAENDGG